MRIRRRKRIIIRKLTVLFINLLVIPLILYICVLSLPRMKTSAIKTAVFSTALLMPEGGYSAVLDAINKENTENTNTNQPDKVTVSTSDENKSETPEQSETRPVNQVQEQQPEQPQEKPAEAPAGSGKIIRKQYSGGQGSSYASFENIFIRNITKIPNAQIIENALKPIEFKLGSNDKPQVLIMHTHTTECYEDQSLDYFDPARSSRTTDNSKNTAAIGEEMAKVLRQNGINVVVDNTQNDYPSYSGAYSRSRKVVESYLKKYPSIKVVLDVHRDAIGDEKVRYAPVVNINGKNAAQIMIISAADDGTLGHPNFFKNLSFAKALNQQMEKDYKGLARPILFEYRNFNQDLTTGSLLIEVGGHANSFEEAVYGGQLFAQSLVNVLKNL